MLAVRQANEESSLSLAGGKELEEGRKGGRNGEQRQVGKRGIVLEGPHDCIQQPAHQPHSRQEQDGVGRTAVQGRGE